MMYNINIKESAQKKIIVEALKTMIRNNNPEPQATYLCNQLEDASRVADCLEEIFKQLRSYHFGHEYLRVSASAQQGIDLYFR